VWGAPQIIAALRKAANDRHPMWWSAMKRANPALVRAAQRYFGTYPRAVEAAGLPTTSAIPPRFRKWAPARVILELQRLHKRPRQLKPAELSERRPAFYQACRARFGSYRRALEAAGIAYKSVARVVAKPMMSHMVVARLRLLHERGSDLRYTQVLRSDPALLAAARRRFGSYANAFRAAGLLYPPKAPLRHWSEPVLLRTLLDLHKSGSDIRHATIKRTRRPLFEAAQYHFGSYVHAVEKAGIDYHAMVRSQLDRAQPISLGD
jgi:hypothetical protein